MVVGVGKRGMHHATAFQANPRFEVVGLCDIDAARLSAAAAKLGNPATGTDAAALAKQIKPDVFCFCTLPNIRTNLIQAAADNNVRLIAFEKPVALTSKEAMAINQIIQKSGIKTVVSHQHRYGEHYRRVKEIIASGALGRVHTVYGTATGWMMHMLSHLIEYMRWFNNNVDAQWVMGQASGRVKLADIHCSPDYIGGFIHFANGVRGIVECGAGAPDVPEVDYWWRKCRIGAQGTEGYAEVLTGGGWRAVTKKGVESGPGCMNYDLDMPPYIQEMADWLDDDKKVHSCNFADAYKGSEIMMGLCRSAMLGGQVALPLTEGMDEIALLKEQLHPQKALLSMAGNAKEYGQ
jgi:predicted dehydrogenase